MNKNLFFIHLIIKKEIFNYIYFIFIINKKLELNLNNYIYIKPSKERKKKKKLKFSKLYLKNLYFFKLVFY